MEERRKIAADLVKAVSKILDGIGKAKLADDLQLLRQDLSLAHERLRGLPSESNYLSIVVLVESELGDKKYNAITKAELIALKSALEIGTQAKPVTFDDCNRTRRFMNSSGLVAGPIIDFDAEEDGSELDAEGEEK